MDTNEGVIVVARISSFLYAESIITNITPQGVKPTVVSPLQIMSLAFLPSSYSFAIIFGIQDFDKDKAHKLTVAFMSEKEEILFSASTESFADPTNNNGMGLPNNFSCAQLSMDLRNINFLVEGIYTTKIWFDNEILGDFPIYVELARDEANAGSNYKAE